MTLEQKQSIFAQNMAKLILHVDSIGLACTIGEVYRTHEQAEIYAKEGKGIIDSLHCKKLAVDLFLFDAQGNYLEARDHYKELGDYWVTLHPENRWGGIFKRCDLVHFEMQDI